MTAVQLTSGPAGTERARLERRVRRLVAATISYNIVEGIVAVTAGIGASSAALAAQLLGKHTSPTQAAVRAERMLRLQEALNTLDAMDREVLSLRHFEEMTLTETALSLGIAEAAAAKRYIRALKRLKAILATMPGGLDSV